MRVAPRLAVKLTRHPVDKPPYRRLAGASKLQKKVTYALSQNTASTRTMRETVQLVGFRAFSLRRTPDGRLSRSRIGTKAKAEAEGKAQRSDNIWWPEQ